jgi:hypothetical protein
MRRVVAVAVGALLLAACGGDGGGSGATSGAASTTEAPAGTLPAGCSLAPFTVVAQRDGDKAAGSATYGVVSAVALPVPLVPKSSVSGTDPAAVMTAGATTDLLGYVLIFGDERFGPDSVSLFGGYGPEAAGHTRGDIAIFPNSPTPLAAGDVLTPGSVDALGLTTTLYRIAMDFKATPDEIMGYTGDVQGTVTIVAVTADAICLDVDLSWQYSDLSSSAGLGTLTFKGMFAADLTGRTTPFT